MALNFSNSLTSYPSDGKENLSLKWFMSTSERLDHEIQALAFIHPNTVLCASSPARLCSSLKWLSPPHVPKPTDSSYPYSTLMCSPLFSVAADNFYLWHRHHTNFHPALPPQLTCGSVLSSAPAGVGCSPASEDSGWIRFHSLLSPDARSTSRCWTSADWRKLDEKTLRAAHQSLEYFWP